MMECLEKFEDILEKESSSSQQMLRMLLFASQTKVDWKWLLASTEIVTNNQERAYMYSSSFCILIMFTGKKENRYNRPSQ